MTTMQSLRHWQKTHKRKPRQYGGDGLYYLMDGARRVNKMHMYRQAAKELNMTRKVYGHPMWWWSGKR